MAFHEQGLSTPPESTKASKEIRFATAFLHLPWPARIGYLAGGLVPGLMMAAATFVGAGLSDFGWLFRKDAARAATVLAFALLSLAVNHDLPARWLDDSEQIPEGSDNWTRGCALATVIVGVLAVTVLWDPWLAGWILSFLLPLASHHFSIESTSIRRRFQWNHLTLVLAGLFLVTPSVVPRVLGPWNHVRVHLDRLGVDDLQAWAVPVLDDPALYLLGTEPDSLIDEPVVRLDALPEKYADLIRRVHYSAPGRDGPGYVAIYFMEARVTLRVGRPGFEYRRGSLRYGDGVWLETWFK